MTRPVTAHAIDQAHRRYGIIATAEDWDRARFDIIARVAGAGNDALLLRYEPNGTERWLVRVAGQPVIAIYRAEHAVIMTVLPANTGDRQRQRAARGGA